VDISNLSDNELAEIFKQSQDERDAWVDSHVETPSLVQCRAKFTKILAARLNSRVIQDPA